MKISPRQARRKKEEEKEKERGRLRERMTGSEKIEIKKEGRKEGERIKIWVLEVRKERYKDEWGFGRNQNNHRTN
jgi:hypothetical protein